MGFTYDLNIENFEQNIDSAIIKRGYDYNKNFQVNEPEIRSAEKYEFIVEGSENYTVHLSLQGRDVVDYDCDCPYDLGPVCKHVAAALYYLKENIEQNEIPEIEPKKKVKKTSKPKKKTEQETFQEILTKVSIEELIAFIEDKAINDRVFREMFFKAFAHRTQIDQKDFFENQIRSAINSATMNGWMDWNGINLLENIGGDMLDSAKKYIENGSYDAAFYICSAILDNICEDIDCYTDEDGEIRNLVDKSLELLSQISIKELSIKVSKMIFDYCISSYDKNIFFDWDINFDFLELSSKFVKSADDMNLLIKIIDEKSLSGDDDEKAQVIKYEILRKLQREAEAQKYLYEHLENSLFRTKALETAFQSGNHDEVVLLAKSGIEFDEKRSPGFVNNWYEWLLRIAQAQNDIDKIILYSRFLLINSNYQNDIDYFGIFKNAVPSSDWELFFENLIDEIREICIRNNTDKIANLYIMDEKWDKLIEILREQKSLFEIEKYEKYLPKDYMPEIIELYTKGIFEYLYHNKSRIDYQIACDYIRKLKNIGGNEIADKLIFDLKIQFKPRRALLEELNKL